MGIHAHITGLRGACAVRTVSMTFYTLTIGRIIHSRWRVIAVGSIDKLSNFSTIIAFRAKEATNRTILLPLIETIWTSRTCIVILGSTGNAEAVARVANTSFFVAHIPISVVFRPVVCSYKSIGLFYWKVEVGRAGRDADVVGGCAVGEIVRESGCA